MNFAPQPRMHPSHRRSKHKPRMIYAEAVCQQPILRLDHVDVTVAGKLRVHAVARLARFAVTDSVWQHDEVFRSVERLLFSEKFAGKLGPDKLSTGASCAVQDEDRVRRFALRILLDLPDRPIVNPQLWQDFARSELEIADGVIGFNRRRVI